MEIINLGLIDYQLAYKRQLDCVEQVLKGEQDKLILCHHPSVVTLGKKSSQEDINGWTGDIYKIERGGQATYHGPGQIVVYPIINLKNYQQNLAGFLECLESSMIETLKSFKLNATGNPDRGKPDYTGVWIEGKKIASIGIAVKKWVTYHGLALNIEHDPLAFQGINPCGFSSSTMTDLSELTDLAINRSELEAKLLTILSQQIAKL